MKEILIINGSGGVGKDTFVNCLRKYTYVLHTSIVNPTKELAKQAGWTGGKTEKDRKFLSDMKKLIDDYNDNNYEQMRQIMRNFIDDTGAQGLLCIDMREKEQIERAKRDFDAKTVLVTRSSVPHITSNMADAGVFDIEYDYEIKNDGSIEELYSKAQDFIRLLSKPCKRASIFYVSHPFGGSDEKYGEIEKVIHHLQKENPYATFVSPVHCFGFQYKTVSYEDGIQKCLWLLDKCDAMIDCDREKTSKGCKIEREHCDKTNKLILSLDTFMRGY